MKSQVNIMDLNNEPRQDNLTMTDGALDLDLGSLNFLDTQSDSDTECEPADKSSDKNNTKTDKNNTKPDKNSADIKKPSYDFSEGISHRKYQDKIKTIDKHVSDNAEIDDLRSDRRKLSERLEQDAEFRQRYLAEQEIARIEKEKQMLENLKWVPKVLADEDSAELLPDDDDMQSIKHSRPNKSGVYIHHVDKLVININL